MPNFYFDCESNTEGRKRPDPTLDKIVSLCYQPIYDDSGKIKGELKILKAWESSEAQILEEFLEITGWFYEFVDVFNFIPVGCNLNYDFTLIIHRCRKLLKKELKWERIFGEIPRVDIKPSLVLANGGKFKGSGLDKFTRKQNNGAIVYKLIQKHKWNDLINYITIEASAFLELYRFLLKKMPILVGGFKQIIAV